MTDLGLAEADWYDAEADAYFASSTALSARYKLLSQAIDSSSKMYTAAVAPGYVTWVTTVSMIIHYITKSSSIGSSGSE